MSVFSFCGESTSGDVRGTVTRCACAVTHGTSADVSMGDRSSRFNLALCVVAGLPVASR